MAMTHDELLAKIKGSSSHWKALRAVVELHRPQKFYDYNACSGCDNRCGCWEGDVMSYNTWETCPTIQAIEKELE